MHIIVLWVASRLWWCPRVGCSHGISRSHLQLSFSSTCLRPFQAPPLPAGIGSPPRCTHCLRPGLVRRPQTGQLRTCQLGTCEKGRRPFSFCRLVSLVYACLTRVGTCGINIKKTHQNPCSMRFAQKFPDP